MAKVQYLRNFHQDHRISMEVYAENLINAVSSFNSDTDVGFEFSSFRPTTRFEHQSSPGLWAMRYARYWEYPRQLKKLSADIYHIVEHGYAHLVDQLPLEKTVVTVHDLIPFLKYKGLIPGVQSDKRPWLSEYSLNKLSRAAHIIAISENTKNDLIDHFGCKEKNISVVHFGLQDHGK